MRATGSTLAILYLLLVALPAYAREGDEGKKPAEEERGKEDKKKQEKEKGKEAGEGSGRDKKRDVRVEDKTRIVFITKTKAKDGRKAEELVWIRLTPVQYRSAKARSRIKRRGVVRILLGPRQLEELNKVLGRDEKAEDEAKKPFKKVMLRVRAVRLRTRRGIKARFVVRPLSLFAKTWKNNELDEPEPKEKE
jgi:hypothetical protein